MDNIFEKCESLEELNISVIYINNRDELYYMFKDCPSIVTKNIKIQIKEERKKEQKCTII